MHEENLPAEGNPRYLGEQEKFDRNRAGNDGSELRDQENVKRPTSNVQRSIKEDSGAHNFLISPHWKLDVERWTFREAACSGGDLNPHAFRHTPLKRTCLPFHHPSEAGEN